MAVLQCDQLTSIRRDRALFRNLGFSLLPGAILTLRGANGSGKTTLLRILAGLLEPEQGRVLYRGERIRLSEDYRGRACYMGHQAAVKTELTVRENVAYWAALRGDSSAVDAALHYWRLAAMADIPCAMLSAGWQKRVALARLLACPAELWLLDEPFVHLDHEACGLLQCLIESRSARGGVIVLSDHQLMADNLCGYCEIYLI